MATSKPVPLKELLDGADTIVGQLIRRSAEIDALTTRVRNFLPTELQSHLLAAREENASLTLVADSAVWAAKLRYHAADILISLTEAQGRSLQNIKVVVAAGRRS
ncbi:MAG: DUF721 domain-containing protein [Gammaproteobacteria bacterium]|nr:DUF721 domain-containing protein [Gammaproteobacteria bacterium]NNF65960.1 DUF721 domain-containing protein [Gammaproteobacteria bacterium]